MPGLNFAGYSAQATAAIDAVIAEAWTLQPMTVGADTTAGDVADASRASVTVNAIYLDREAKPTMAYSYDVRQARRPGLESGTPRLKISPSELANQRAANAAFAVRARDQFERQADGVAWRVSSIEPLAGGALLCNINALG